MVEIEKPRIECIDSQEDPSYGKYVVEPLERGYGDRSECQKDQCAAAFAGRKDRLY